MLDHIPQIVHFSGHGEGTQGIALEDQIGKTQLANTDALASLFELFSEHLNCVVLNACYSYVQAEAIANHIPYVIGMCDQIGDQAAISFAVAFYDALGAGRDVDFAYKNACVAIKMEGIPQAHIPVLHKKIKVEDISKLPSQALTVPANPRKSAPFSAYNSANFAGRETETHQFVNLLKANCRILAIVGMTGIGKTILAERVVDALESSNVADSRTYYRFSLDDEGLSADLASSGAALLRSLGEEPTLDDQQDPNNLLNHLLNCLCSRPYRVQIDSLERLLQGNEQKGWSEFCDPLWLKLFQRFLAGNACSSQLILTSQDLPADLIRIASTFPQFWHCQKLEGLDSDEQQELFQKTGLPQDAESLEILERIGDFYNGHPLVLQVIAEEMRKPPFQGKPSHYWQKHQTEFVKHSTNVSQIDQSKLFRIRIRHKVEQTIQRLPDQAWQMLCASAVFRCPVPITFWQDMAIDCDPVVAFDLLEDRHLVEDAPSKHERLVHQHNLIRSAALTSLKSDSSVWEVAHHRAADIWLTAYSPAPDASNIEKVRGWLEAFEHYCEVKDWDKASEIYNKPVGSDQRPLHMQLLGWSYYKELIKVSNRLAENIASPIKRVCLNQIGNAYRNQGQIEKSIKYYQQAFEFAHDTRDRIGESRALGCLGSAHNSLGKYAEATEFFKKALRMAREVGDSQGVSTYLGNLGMACHHLGETAEAICYYQQALTLARKIEDRAYEGRILGNLGGAYHNLGKYQLAIQHHEEHLKIAQEIGDRQSEGNALCNLGDAYSSLKDYRQSIIYHQQALKISQEINDQKGEDQDLHNLALAHQELKEYAAAIEYHSQRIQLARKAKNHQLECEALFHLGDCQARLEKYAEAVESMKTALAVARQIEDRSWEARTLKRLTDLSQKLGEYPFD
ncbi:tetratricopeptide repeat protein [Nodosilinea sp. LEGE 07298]|nr:tetratricopeptide repeat protein [Nodosilinea sp. LEGE 07298]MBE9112303.1 tetratricopeptide repeat protein [Nodosilinea sp. LEGE 07298]